MKRLFSTLIIISAIALLSCTKVSLTPTEPPAVATVEEATPLPPVCTKTMDSTTFNINTNSSIWVFDEGVGILSTTSSIIDGDGSLVFPNVLLGHPRYLTHKAFYFDTDSLALSFKYNINDPTGLHKFKVIVGDSILKEDYLQYGVTEVKCSGKLPAGWYRLTIEFSSITSNYQIAIDDIKMSTIKLGSCL